MPDTARPRISIFDEVAAPHNADPNSKRAKKARKDVCSYCWLADVASFSIKHLEQSLLTYLDIEV
jgi:hypothetical protein